MPANPFWRLRNTGNATHVRIAPGQYKRRRTTTNWSGSRYGGMPPRMRGYYRRSGYWRRDGRTAGGSVEMKFFDKQVALGVGNYIAGIEQDGPIVGIAQGSGEQDRQGRKIIVKSLYIRAHVKLIDNLATGTFNTPQTLRFLIVEDRQSNGVLLTVADLFELPPPGVGYIHAVNNLSNKNRFKVHMDKVIQLSYVDSWTNNTDTTYYQQGRMVTCNFYKKFNLPVEFSGTGISTMSNIQSSNLSYVFITENGQPTVQIEGLSRVRFVG